MRDVSGTVPLRLFVCCPIDFGIRFGPSDAAVFGGAEDGSSDGPGLAALRRALERRLQDRPTLLRRRLAAWPGEEVEGHVAWGQPAPLGPGIRIRFTPNSEFGLAWRDEAALLVPWRTMLEPPPPLLSAETYASIIAELTVGEIVVDVHALGVGFVRLELGGLPSGSDVATVVFDAFEHAGYGERPDAVAVVPIRVNRVLAAIRDAVVEAYGKTPRTTATDSLNVEGFTGVVLMPGDTSDPVRAGLRKSLGDVGFKVVADAGTLDAEVDFAWWMHSVRPRPGAEFPHRFFHLLATGECGWVLLRAVQRDLDSRLEREYAAQATSTPDLPTRQEVRRLRVLLEFALTAVDPRNATKSTLDGPFTRAFVEASDLDRIRTEVLERTRVAYELASDAVAEADLRRGEQLTVAAGLLAAASLLGLVAMGKDFTETLKTVVFEAEGMRPIAGVLNPWLNHAVTGFVFLVWLGVAGATLVFLVLLLRRIRAQRRRAHSGRV